MRGGHFTALVRLCMAHVFTRRNEGFATGLTAGEFARLSVLNSVMDVQV